MTSPRSPRCQRASPPAPLSGSLPVLLAPESSTRQQCLWTLPDRGWQSRRSRCSSPPSAWSASSQATGNSACEPPPALVPTQLHPAQPARSCQHSSSLLHRAAPGTAPDTQLPPLVPPLSPRSFGLMMRVFGAGVAVSLLLTVPPWPFLRRHQLPWLRKPAADDSAGADAAGDQPAAGGKAGVGGAGARGRRCALYLVSPRLRRDVLPFSRRPLCVWLCVYSSKR